ncbi:hypothetical protein XBKB1_910015 [Xenorhabdus bovienii str. kraussei Becker Underwood]|uniref:Uncharacterized protein n=1 Tax=Xenorhabdus bovienii str. kraussei Becker Underwood TaxID=1398204 RepID=A0A077PR32_XENBV|nr:hypothetical protein XBKB1_910015 [Xenorhabdus bovienii str. kraussei Becker Underwood]
MNLSYHTLGLTCTLQQVIKCIDIAAALVACDNTILFIDCYCWVLATGLFRGFRSNRGANAGFAIIAKFEGDDVICHRYLPSGSMPELLRVHRFQQQLTGNISSTQQTAAF